MGSKEETHYQVLGLHDPSNATLTDIKKAYRRLALQYHPDRNAPEKKEESTRLFRRVNEAYEVLSDPVQRREYDQELIWNSRPNHGVSSMPYTTSSTTYNHPTPARQRQYRDPFAQFDDLFSSDPFFQEAFRDMDELFVRTFQQKHNRGGNQPQPSAGSSLLPPPPPPPQKKSWGRWLIDCLGINLQLETVTTTFDSQGRPVQSRSHTTYGQDPTNAKARTYASQSTQTIVQPNGQRVTIQRLERNGNQIEEHYRDHQLIQRLINGVPQPLTTLKGS